MNQLRLPFVRRIAGVFATRIAQFVLGFGSSFIIAKFLGPEGRGAYVAVLLVPGTVFALGQLGWPSAINYFAGSGAPIKDLVRWSVIVTVVYSIAIFATAIVLLPVLEGSILKAAPPELLRLVLLTLPVSALAACGGSILYGRQAIRPYSIILVGQSVGSLVGIVVLVGVLHLGVPGAIATSIIVGIIGAIAVLREVRRVARADPGNGTVSLRDVAGYGLKLYPASVTSFFNYRADVYLLQSLLAAPGRAVGLYSYAVSLAELTFYIPDSVSTIFFPHVAGSTEEASNRQVGQVARFTILLTLFAAIGLVPAGWLLFQIVLPTFSDAFPAMLVLLPGVVSLSLSKILSSYVSARRRPGPPSVAATAGLAANIAANLVLIPMLGIVGASAASVISYTCEAVILLAVVSRMTGQSPRSLIVPGRTEFDRLFSWLGLIAGVVGARLRRGRG